MKSCFRSPIFKITTTLTLVLLLIVSTPALATTTSQLNSDGTGTTTVSLGDQSDETRLPEDECITIDSNNNRRVGTCQDGWYLISTSEADSAGNEGKTKSYYIERDTVKPLTPTINISKTGNILAEYLSVNILAESESTILLEITNNGNNNGSITDNNSKTTKIKLRMKKGKTLDIIDSRITTDLSQFENSSSSSSNFNNNTNNSNTINNKQANNNSAIYTVDQVSYNPDNILNRALQCGNTTYTITAKQIDRAGNISNSTKPITITTKPCPICGFSNGMFTSPFHNQNAYIAHPFGKSANYASGTADHGGVDYNGIPHGTDIYATYPGTIQYADYSQRDDYGKDLKAGGWSSTFGNQVIINHGNIGGKTIKTIYTHLMPENATQLRAGDYVDQNTIIGRMGSTGRSTGSHLHLEVRSNNIQIDPELFLGKQNTNIPDSLYSGYCPAEGHGGLEDGFDGYPDYTISEDEQKQLLAQYLIDNFSSYTELESFYVSQEYKERLSGVSDRFIQAYFWDYAKGLATFIKLENSCDVKYIKVDKTYDKNNNEIAYDGIVMLNPYTNDPYFVKNGIYDKYQREDKACGIIGVPKSEEGDAAVRDDSVAMENQAWYQRFERRLPGEHTNGDYTNNSIYGYKWEKGCQRLNPIKCKKGFESFFVVNSVADKYEQKGGTSGSYGFAVEDTQLNRESSYKGMFATKQFYCYQEFENKTINTCSKKQDEISTPLSKVFDVKNEHRDDQGGWWDSNNNIRDGIDPNVRSVNFQVIHDAGNSDNLQKWDGKSDVYLLFHGWENDPDSSSFYNLDNWIKIGSGVKSEQPNAIVLVLNWKEAASSCCTTPLPRVDKAAPWVVPTAREVKKHLDRWSNGQLGGDNIHIIGHSLGTLLSAETARQYGGVVDGTLMDPPNQGNAGGFSFGPELNGYDLDGNTEGEQTVYSLSGGKEQNDYFKDVFGFSRSFVGDTSLPGNRYLAVTAHETFSISFDDESNCNSITSMDCTLLGSHFWVRYLFANNLHDPNDWNDILSTKNMRMTTSNSFEENALGKGNRKIDGKIYTKGEKEGVPDYLRLNDDGDWVFYGNDLDNIIDPRPKYIVDKNNEVLLYMHGGYGDDVFYSYGSSINRTPIKNTLSLPDFNKGSDSIILKKNMFDYIAGSNSNNDYVILRKSISSSANQYRPFIIIPGNKDLDYCDDWLMDELELARAGKSERVYFK